MNAKEAEQVREMYRIAANAETLEAGVRTIQARGFRTKAWTTQAGKRHAARPFSRMTLRLLLSNVLYTGAVNHKGTVYPGEHQRIVEQELWERVSTQLQMRSTHQRGREHRPQEAPLTGLLWCRDCGSVMRSTYKTKRGRRHRYYRCRTASVSTRDCSQSAVEATDLETFLIRNLEPMVGSGVNWAAIRESIERVEYEGRRHRVAIAWKDGTRVELEMPLPNRRGVKGGEGEPEVGRVPRVSRLMALAIRYERLIREGSVRHYRDIAEAGQISRARMSQIMNLADLAPEIQEALLFLPKTVAGPDHITEKACDRLPVRWTGTGRSNSSQN